MNLPSRKKLGKWPFDRMYSFLLAAALLSFAFLLIGCVNLSDDAGASAIPFDVGPEVAEPITIHFYYTNIYEEMALFTIEDSWTGNSDLAPIEAFYELKPAEDGYRGVGQFVAGAFSGNERTVDVPIFIPEETMKEFIAAMVGEPLVDIPYEPVVANDDYEYIRFTFDLPYDEVEILSYSLAPQNVPWEVRIVESTLVIPNGSPSEAYELLHPYLQKDVQTEFLDTLARELYGE